MENIFELADNYTLHVNLCKKVNNYSTEVQKYSDSLMNN